MAEPKLNILANGQEIQIADVNLLGDTSAYADDRVLAEFLRMPPYNGSTVTKGIIPFTEDYISNTGTDVLADDPYATVGTAQGASRGLVIRPFRAIIGSTTPVGTDSKKNWRDIRSTIFLGSSTVLNGSVTLSANASGLNRIDLVYAAVSVDANSAGVVRYLKDPTTSVITSPSTVVTVVSTVTVGVVTGTASLTPATVGFPVIPADAAGVYYIPLAYVRVQNGVTSLSTSDIYSIAPFLPFSRATGTSIVRPATGQWKLNAGIITSARLNTWANAAALTELPLAYIPPTALGAEELFIALDLAAASSASWSHAIYGTVDDSRDWRKRLFFSWAQAADSTGSPAGTFAWQGGTVALVPRSGVDIAGIGATPGTYIGSGQSFQDQLVVGVGGFAGPNNGMIAFQANANQLNFTAAGTVYIYVDSVTGALKFYQSGSVPRAYVFIMLKAYGPIQYY